MNGIKPYRKPEVRSMEVDSQVIRMFTGQGFIDVFREELIEVRKLDPKISEKAVFDRINQRIFDVFNEFRYSGYDSFTQRMGKKNRYQ